MSKNEALVNLLINLANAKVVETNRPTVKQVKHNGKQYVETWFYPRFIKRKRDGKVMCWCESELADCFVLPSYFWSEK